MALNLKQILGILIVIFSVLAISGASLAEVVGPTAAKSISALANILNAIMGGVFTVITGQTAMVKDVAAMPGVERIQVNASASQALAQVAFDPNQDKVEATDQDSAEVQKTANK